MFERKIKRKYITRISHRGFKSIGESPKKVGSEEILEVIQKMYDKEGSIVINFIDNETISITSLKTIKNYEVENKLEEIKDLIRDGLKI